jgi:Ca-activated chloride channel family protein
MPSTRLGLLTLLPTLGFTLAGCSESIDDYGDDELGSDWGDTGGDYGDEADESTSEEEDDDDESTDTTETGEPTCNDADPVVLYLSPDDSNSTSSPAQVEDRVLGEGATSLWGIPIRRWEFMNYYEFPYAPPAEPGSLSVHAAMQPVEGFEARHRLQIGVASEWMADEARPPLNLTLVMDTSGSMEGEAIELLRETGKVIASQLRAGDTVSMVEWDTQNTWVLAGYEVEGPNDPLVLAEIDALQAGGGTDLNAGLQSGYALAQEVFDPTELNRLVLISDGGANAGEVDPDLIAQNAALEGADGIYLVGVGVNSSQVTYNDHLMDVLTDLGKGASLYIDSSEEAQQMFGTRFLETIAIAARNVQVELTMPPGFEIVKFSGEEFSGDPTEIEPQHIAPNDAMVFHQQVETCAPELVDEGSTITVKLTWQDVWTFEPRSLERTWTFAELFGADQTMLLKGAAVLAYAEELEALTSGKPMPEVPAIVVVDAARAALPEDADLATMAAILEVVGP